MRKALTVATIGGQNYLKRCSDNMRSVLAVVWRSIHTRISPSRKWKETENKYIEHIIFSILGKQNVIINYNKNNSIIIIKITNTNLLLTIKEEYDKFNLAKGNVNKTNR